MAAFSGLGTGRRDTGLPLTRPAIQPTTGTTFGTRRPGPVAPKPFDSGNVWGGSGPVGWSPSAGMQAYTDKLNAGYAAQQNAGLAAQGYNAALGGSGGLGGINGQSGGGGTRPSVYGGGGGGGGLEGQFTSQLSGLMQNPGMDQATTEGIINQGTEGISESQQADQLALKREANAAGFGQSGSLQAGQAAQAQAYSGQRANLARDVRLAAAENAKKNQMATLGLTADWLGQQQKNQLEQQRLDAEKEAQKNAAVKNTATSYTGVSGNQPNALSGFNPVAVTGTPQYGGDGNRIGAAPIKIGGGTGLYAGQGLPGSPGISSGASPWDRQAANFSNWYNTIGPGA